MELKDIPSEDSFQATSEQHQSVLSIDCLSSHSVEITAPTCRICQISGNSSNKDVGELLVSPCECRGSLGFVHKFCMEKWLNMRNQDTCELCHFKFVTKRRFKPFHELQFGNVFGVLSGSEKGVLVLGLINFFLLLLEIPFLYYVIKITSSFFNSILHETEEVTDEPRSQVYSLLLVLLLLFTLVLFASSLTFTVFGVKVFRKMLDLSRELVLIIPTRQSKEKVVEL